MSINSYAFNNLARIGSDVDDNTQRTLYNTRFSNHILSNYFSENLSDTHVKFATEQPALMYNAINGVGIAGSVVDVDSLLHLKNTNERPLEKLQLMQRPFITVPYLGRGSCDPVLESQLHQGEIVSDRKSVSTISETTYINYDTYPLRDDLKSRINNPAYSVEEAALSGWVRGGVASREMANDTNFSKNYRPKNNV